MIKPEISIIVCTYNRAELLSGCLKSLVEQVTDKCAYEIIVVDNNSPDNTQAVTEQFIKDHLHFRVVKELRQGLSYSRNRGWKEALGEYIAYIDDDARAAPDWCERILNAFKTVTPKPAAVGGEIHPFYETEPPKWFTDDFEIRTWGSEPGFLKPPRAQFGFSGSNMAFRKDILETFGGFSTDYGIVGNKLRLGEDAEFFQRVYKKEPFFWYDPAIKVYHWTPKKNMRVSYRFWRSFKSGEAIAIIHGRKICSYNYLKTFAKLILQLAAIPLVLFKTKNQIKGVVDQLQKIGGALGYLFG